MKEDTKLLKISEVAKLLNVHPNTLRKWDKKGILVATRFGERKDRRYEKIVIEKFIGNKHK